MSDRGCRILTRNPGNVLESLYEIRNCVSSKRREGRATAWSARIVLPLDFGRPSILFKSEWDAVNGLDCARCGNNLHSWGNVASGNSFGQSGFHLER
jgi:hypothetical protein